MRTVIIPQASTPLVPVWDIRSPKHQRVIKFRADCKFAVVFPSMDSGKGYTTHKALPAALKQIRRVSSYRFFHFIDSRGCAYHLTGDTPKMDVITQKYQSIEGGAAA